MSNLLLVTLILIHIHLLVVSSLHVLMTLSDLLLAVIWDAVRDLVRVSRGVWLLEIVLTVLTLFERLELMVSLPLCQYLMLLIMDFLMLLCRVSLRVVWLWMVIVPSSVVVLFAERLDSDWLGGMLQTFYGALLLAHLGVVYLRMVYLLLGMILLWSHLNFTTQRLTQLVIVTVTVTLLLNLQLVDPLFVVSIFSW
jgi:hypothetical protein